MQARQEGSTPVLRVPGWPQSGGRNSTVPPPQLARRVPAAPIRVQFTVSLAASALMPTLSLRIAGRGQVEGDTAVFTPARGYLQNAHVTLKIPGGPAGMISLGEARAGTGGVLASSATQRFTGSFSTLPFSSCPAS